MNRRFLLIFLGGLAALVAVAVAAVPFVVPTGAVRGEIEQRVSQATGRAFKIEGGLAFTLFPALGFTAHHVTLANMPGGRAPHLAEIDVLRIGVKLLPLLSGRIEADEIECDRPLLALEVARDGRANWELRPGRGAEAGTGVAVKTAFAGIAVSDGTVTYDNARLGSRREIDHLSARVALTRLDRPAGVSGAFAFRGRRLNYSLSAATTQTLLAGKGTRVTVAIASDFLNAGFFGAIGSDGLISGTGSLRTPSLKDVAAWLGRPASAGAGLGPLDIRAAVAVHDRSASLTNIAAKIDGMTVSGYLDADLRAPVPAVNGVLSVDRLDLNTYLRGGPPAPGAPKAPAPIRPPGGGWSKTAINLDLLKLMNGRLTLNVGRLDVLHLKLGKTVIAATLAGGSMTATMSPMQLYGGTGAATLIVDARAAAPLVANKLVFSNIAFGPFLADTIGVDKIDGRGTIMLDVTSKGASPDAIMRGLSGKGSVVIGHGSVRGVDMGMVARTVTTILSAGATGTSAATDFDRFGGSFTIANGILTNNDLKLSSPFINMTGAGHLDLGNQTIAYRIEPKASIGGKLNLLDVGVPFAITGSWSHLRYVPDLAGAVSGLIGSVLGKGTAPIEGLLDGLAGPPAGTKKKSKSVGDTLKGMFGIH
ncbi:MAG: AsmA family protein [Rhizomicrobium sp.]